MSQHLAWSSLNDMIHFISSCDLWFIDLDLTCSSPLFWSIGAKSCSSFPATRFIASKPPTCPKPLQPVHQAKPYLDLLHLVTWLHVMSHMQRLLRYMCELWNKTSPFPPPWFKLLTQLYLWTNPLCISHKHILVHLGCHSITKTKLGTFQSSPFW
jgi:hypothetical protein